MTRILIALTLGLAACGTPCDRERDVVIAGAERCGQAVIGDTDVEAECTEEAAVIASCLTPCFRGVPCGAFDGSDADAMAELGRCQSDCLFPDAQ